MAVLQEELNPRIDDIDMKPLLGIKVRTYHNLLDDYMSKRGDISAIHTVGQYQPFA